MNKKNSLSFTKTNVRELSNLNYYIELPYLLNLNKMQFSEVLKSIDQLDGNNLAFIDIEATDDKFERKFIQFSGVKFDSNGKNIDQINIVINPEQQLSDYIINLLKIDDEYLSDKPNWNKVKDEISKFLDNTVMVTFGDFDISIIKKNIDLIHYNIKFFDFQLWLKKLSGSNVGLIELSKLIYENIETELQHNAYFDAFILSEVFYEIKKLTSNEISQLCLLSHISPRIAMPKHKIFSSIEFANMWKNKITKKSKPFVIEDISILECTYKTRNGRRTIPYLNEFKGYYLENNVPKYVIWKNKIVVGQHTYELYLDVVKKFLNAFLDMVSNKAIFINNCGKEKVTIFTEIIYDATKKYIAMNFINLSYLNRKFKSKDGLNIFNELIKESTDEIKAKFIGYYND